MQQLTTDKANRPFDVILYGASSFVGKYVAEYLLARSKQENFRWAIAGRDRAKLDALKAWLGAPELVCFIADAADDIALSNMVKEAKVVASTVGPYALYGSALVRACAAQGTDYCDLTAEIPWMREMIDTYQPQAQRSGARLVHACGFDSIPSDLGCWYLQQRSLQQFGEPCQRVHFRLRKVKGGFSGGTSASLVDMVKKASENEVTRHLLLDPYALTDNITNTPQKDRFFMAYDRDAHAWNAPFIMATFNTRIVQRTHFLLGQPWGSDFTYDEAMLTGSGVLGATVAVGVTAALGSLIGLTAYKHTRPLIQKFLPAPGEGPSLAAIEKGFFVVDLYGHTRNGKSVKMEIKGQRDPGYGATAHMLAEAALTLAADSNNEKVNGGFWTPATAMGKKLIERLEKFGGMSFEKC